MMPILCKKKNFSLTRLHQGIGAGILLQLSLLLTVNFFVHVYGVAVQDTCFLITEKREALLLLLIKDSPLAYASGYLLGASENLLVYSKIEPLNSS